MPASVDSSSFLWRTIAAFVVVISLLAAGVVVAVQRLDEVAGARLSALRTEEQKITTVERLRWSAELMVSAGRGYLVSGAPELASALQRAVEEFTANLQRLEDSARTADTLALVAEVERTADDFRRTQAELVAARSGPHDGAALARRFEADLRPPRRQLSAALDRLVERKTAKLEQTYAQMARDRARLMSSTWALVGALVVLALAIAGLFAGRLLRAYRTQEEAHARVQRALSTRDEVLGIVAHDLRNPLGAITMKAAGIRRLADADAVRRHATSIENVAIRMDYIIKGLLDVASVEAGHFAISPAPCPVEQLLQEAMDIFGTVAAAKAITLERTVDEPRLAVHADRDRIMQVLSNLVANAIKFTPQGGRVRIAVGRQDHEVRFTVADTGPGITAQDAPHIFERFWKHEKAGSKGTGLGLFIAQRIVGAHAGRIWLETDPGRGARFSFVLPMADPEAALAGDGARDGAAGGDRSWRTS